MNQDDMKATRSTAAITAAKSHCPILFYPDYTVGPGVTPDLLTQAIPWNCEALAGYTAGGDLHPALRIMPGEIAKPSRVSPAVCKLQADHTTMQELTLPWAQSTYIPALR